MFVGWANGPFIILLLLMGSAGFLFAQPVANFSANNTSGCGSMLVLFSSTSTGTINSYNWNFGNGNTSTLPSPGVVYTSPGTYTVTLTVSGPGGSNTLTRTNYITVFAKPTSVIGGSPTSGCAPLDVQFSNASTPGSGTIASQFWDFGDGNSSLLANPTHTYAPGSYSIHLTTTNSNGCSATSPAFFVQAFSLLSAGFTADTTTACNFPFTVQFTDTTAGGGPLSYNWDFGDGNTSTAANPLHTYATAGNYTVTLVATQGGCSDTAIRSNLIQYVPLQVAFAANDTQVCPGSAVAFQDTSVGTPISWEWDFGDGATDNVQNPTHAYAATGFYTVRLIVTNALGCRDTLTKTNWIEVLPTPGANFSAPVVTGCRSPLTVNFANASTGAASYLWDFGDASTSTATAPTHTYTVTGNVAATFDVQLIATSAAGCQDTLVRPAYVQISPPVADFRDSTVQSGCIPKTVRFFNQSTSAFDPITTYAWTFGQGAPSAIPNPVHTYPTAGVWTVRLIVTTATGCKDTLTMPNLISTGTMPNASFTVSNNSPCYGTPVTFTSTSTGNPDTLYWNFGSGYAIGAPVMNYTFPDTGCFAVNLVASNHGCNDTVGTASIVCVRGVRAQFGMSATSACRAPATVNFTNQSASSHALVYDWDFGDGSPHSALANPSHTYNATGTYTITLTATDNVAGCTNATTRTFTIRKPTAAFTPSVTVGCANLPVTFTNNSLNATTYVWTFGDGGSSTLANPTHTYFSGGNFSVQLIATDALGCSDTLIQNALVHVHDIEPDFMRTPSLACLGDTVFFTDMSGSDGLINAWNWNFGDGMGSSQQNPRHVYAAAGTYDIRLIVYDNNGCSDSIRRQAYVQVVQPTASFNMSSLFLCPGQTLNVLNTGTGLPPITANWNFGDGNSAVGNIASNVYALPGTYPVKLEITDAAGCQAVMIRTLTVAPAAASFTVSDSVTNCPPLQVQFTNTSTGNIVGWQWSFGDGSGSTQPNPTHLYDSVGSYTVVLIVRTNSGCRDTIVMPGRVVVGGPQVSFQSSQSAACTGDSVQFILNSSGGITSVWDFGDGFLQVGGDTVSHMYTGANTYQPILIALDSTGCVLTAPQIPPITVLPAPVAAFSVSNASLCRNDTTQFVDLSTYGAGGASVIWDFGDGSGGIGSPVQHSYALSDSFTVTLTVTDSLGCAASDTMVAAVVVHQYQAGFVASPSVACVGSGVQFTDTSLHDSPIIAWVWDFGDGSQGNANPVNHSYADTGHYNVQLIITTAEGCMDTVRTNQAVWVEEPQGSFLTATDSSCLGNPVVFFLAADSSFTVNWNWGDGFSQIGGDTVSHPYLTSGLYLPSVTLTDSFGCTHVYQDTVGVRVMPGPTAAMLVDTSLHCRPDSILLADNSAYPSGMGSLHWDFGDGGMDSVASVMHFYAAPGSYDVILSVVDALGCTDADTLVGAVVIHQQMALFGADSTTGCLPVTIQFSDSSTADDGVVAWAWDFGDGGNGTGPNPSHVYTDTGSYNVILVITTLLGCQDTMVLPSLIDIHPPAIPSIWAASVEGDNSVSVLFRADSSLLFDSYELYRVASGYSHIASTYVQTDTLLMDLNANSLAVSNCYVPMVADVCRDSSALPPARVHCTMELQAIAGTDQNTLIWTPYVGWDSLLRYEIYQVADYDTTAGSLLATVPATSNSFVDSSAACAQLRTYRIRAVGLAMQERSWSDTSAARPAHSAPAYQPQMVTTSVVNNADLQVSWLPSPLPGPAQLELFRSTDGSAWASRALLPSTATTYLDQAANVGAQSYYYRVEMEDSCGYRTQPSGHARSILLQLDGSDGTAQLQWNAYGDWANGVARYDLEARTMSGTSWTLIQAVGAGTLRYHDEVGLPSEDGVCYRVTAYESAGNLALSRSNEVCFSRELWVPNTITPNGDAYNDVLQVRGIAAYPGTGITIYNRWGNVVYQVDDYANDWAGTNGKRGEPLPDGTYFWVLRVSDGRELRGYVTILR